MLHSWIHTTQTGTNNFLNHLLNRHAKKITWTSHNFLFKTFVGSLFETIFLAKSNLTNGYATMVHGRGCNPHRSTTTFANLEITSLWRHNSEIIRDGEKRRPPRAMKSSELSNGETRIALRQLLQTRKWRQWWRHNLGSRWKLQKMAQKNFSIGAFYNITKNQDNPIKTVGQDSFLAPKPLKIGVTQPPGVAQPLYSRGHN